MSELLFRAVIPGRARILKNGKSIKKNFATGKRFIGKSDRYVRWESFAKLFIYKNKPPTKPINFPVILKLSLYLKNHQHEPDLSNAYQGVEDILQKCGVIENDRLIGGHDGSRKIIAPNEPERVIIELFRLSEDKVTSLPFSHQKP